MTAKLPAPGQATPANPSRPAPATKAARQSRIVAILSREQVHSQEQLASLLSQYADMHVAQATLSRDLDELGVVRLRAADGTLMYALPGDPGGPGSRPGTGLDPHNFPERSGLSPGSSVPAARADNADADGADGRPAAPGSVQSAPVSAQGSQVSAQAGQVSAQASPASAQSAPGSAQGSQVSAQASRGSVQSAPVSAQASPGSVQSAPGSAQASRGSVQSAPVSAQGSQVSAQADQVSAQRSPVSAQAAPVRAQSAPVSAQAGPVDAQALPVSAQASRVSAQGGRVSAHARPVSGPASHVSGATARLTRYLRELLTSAEASANLVVLRTPAGAAQFLASAIDHAAWPGVLGTVAGDDTVLVISRDPAGGDDLAAEFRRLAEGRR